MSLTWPTKLPTSARIPHALTLDYGHAKELNSGLSVTGLATSSVFSAFPGSGSLSSFRLGLKLHSLLGPPQPCKMHTQPVLANFLLTLLYVSYCSYCYLTLLSYANLFVYCQSPQLECKLPEVMSWSPSFCMMSPAALRGPINSY